MRESFTPAKMLGPFAYLRKLKYGSYTRSKKAHLYEQIAQDKGSSPQNVYEIAHGKPVNSPEEQAIHDILLEIGIIQFVEKQ